ncbi:hypothetical protein L5515_012868 [Caenorhabditis briggsae]|uniref:GATA-type domain-containing protein n=2 Tax=Caenorhabditis briggsae TaxID=6238 RepID=A0AAE9JH47_CAEBR|nr:hypothetical protein L5515_012868 [Caenorhabditis briggsae]
MTSEEQDEVLEEKQKFEKTVKVEPEPKEEIGVESNGSSAVAATAEPAGPCAGCVQLHQEIRQDVKKIMNKIETVCERLEVMLAEKERMNQEQMSESGSEEKYAGSPSGSRESPAFQTNGKMLSAVMGNGGSRKRKPTKESVNRLFENSLIHENGNGSTIEKVPRQVSTPVSASSPFADFNHFNGGLMFDPMPNPQNMMQFLNLVQQQQHHQQAQQAAQIIQKEAQKVKEDVKQKPLEISNSPPNPGPNEQDLLSQLASQFNGKSPSPSVVPAAGSPEDDSSNSGGSRCSNCSTTKTTAWRRDLAGKLVCNACGLYYRLHRTHRPVHMRKDFIQQRFRRKIKEDENPAISQEAVFSQLLGMPPGGAAYSLMEHLNQLSQVQEESAKPSTGRTTESSKPDTGTTTPK